AGFRDAPESFRDDAAQRVALALPADAEPVFRLVDAHAAGEPDATVRKDRGLLLAGGERARVTEHLCQEVLKRHESGDTAVLIDDDRLLRALTPELRDEPLAAHRLRHTGDWSHRSEGK